MVELLEPGTEAETCFMAGRGMNGLKGIIVCYNPNIQRYTLELEKGDMMSLRVRNVRPIKKESDGTRSGDKPKEEESNEGSDVSSSLPGRSFAKADAKEEQVKEEQGGGSSKNTTTPTGIFDTVSPSTMIFAAIAAYLYVHSDFNKSSPSNSTTSGPEHDPTVRAHRPNPLSNVSTPVLITSAIFAYLAWEWGTKPNRHDRGEFKITNLVLRVSYCSIIEILLLVGLALWGIFAQPIHHIVGASVLVFVVWQFGTNGGRRAFSWNNIEHKVRNMNLWEVVFLARLLERGLNSLGSIAGGNRRRY